MDSTGKFFAFIGIAITLFLSLKGVQGMMREQEEKMKEARDDGFRAGTKQTATEQTT